MKKQGISLISYGYSEYKFQQLLAEQVGRVFDLPVETREEHLDLTVFFDARRGQYNANELLTFVNQKYASGLNKTMALFNVDLFIPIFTFIFGQAYLNGQTGVASRYRLSNMRYGMEPDDDLLLQRFTKEVVHELGHTFGLIHCHTPDCVMRSSTYVEDIDQKNTEFCKSCRTKLKNHD